MDDLTSKLTQLLESDDGLDKIKSLAGSLLGGLGSEPEQSREEKSDAPNLMSLASGDNMQFLMKMASMLSANKDDDRTRLLMAIRPYLKEERKERVDKAIRLLQLASLLPFLTESGLFSNLTDLFK